MRRLILMRHAKSGWDNPELGDHERSLNGRGQRSAKGIGNWLRGGNYIPNQILSSSSTRTKETCAELSFDCEKTFLDSLYLAEEAQMLKELRKANGDTVLMLGHNPGIAYFAQDLVGATPDHPRFSDFPTCATLVVDFDITDWTQIKLGTGRVENFITPRELTEG